MWVTAVWSFLQPSVVMRLVSGDLFYRFGYTPVINGHHTTFDFWLLYVRVTPGIREEDLADDCVTQRTV